jgi:hypothetical protein
LKMLTFGILLLLMKKTMGYQLEAFLPALDKIYI